MVKGWFIRLTSGRLLLNQLASFAEYERELIVSRIRSKTGKRWSAEAVSKKPRKCYWRMKNIQDQQGI